MPQPRSTPRFVDYLTVGEAAEFLGVSPWTLRNWDKAGRLKPMRHPKNGYRIYRHEDLEAVLSPGPVAGERGEHSEREEHRERADTCTPTATWNGMGES